MDGIPAGATRVVFKFGRNMDGTFHVWPSKGGKWQWQAFSNNGEEATQEQAISAAREWIMYDYDKTNNDKRR